MGVVHALTLQPATNLNVILQPPTQIGDPADGVTTALWDLTRYQGPCAPVRLFLPHTYTR